MKFPVRMVGKHGAMHAYSVSEVAHLQSLGWAVEVPDPPVVPVINGDTSREPEEVIDADLPPVLYERDSLSQAMSIDEARDETTPVKRKPGRPRRVQ